MVREGASDGGEEPSDREVDFCVGPGREGADCEVEDDDVVVEDESEHDG